ncbi:uncharacterized protein LOC122275111 [Carya illinoinensis]|uniref:Uncharacterized protein ycf33 n=1 Tax=Carya illinoinensis TaxID=32201 RepID=A0A922E2L3_CARIL|nr:uncharacterized protein LOC122275111 [Carya illinoinensis]KAG6695563.1 hypothetical protein I3842_09G104400 [Carya illinoinensis]
MLQLKEMKTIFLRSQFYLPYCSSFTNSSSHPPSLVPIKTTTSLKHSINSPTATLPSKIRTIPRQTILHHTKSNQKNKPLILELVPKCQIPSKDQEPLKVSPNRYSRFVIVGAVSFGLVLFLVGMDDQMALALGPEGPLMEEFWDNVRRYALYALTVSTGAIYTIFLPIVELLKNPISAILVITIFAGGIFIVSQVLSAMVGVSDFTYDYGY